MTADERDDEHAPKWARATDNGRYYQDPKTGEMLISVTNAIDTLNIPALAPAAARETAAWMMDHLPAAVRASRNPDDREAFLGDARKHYREVWDRRRDLGSRIHRHAEAKVLGKPMPPDGEVGPFIDSYMRFLKDFRVDIEQDVASAEVTVLHRRLRYGGTADLWTQLSFPDDVGELRRRSRLAVPQPTPSGLWLVDLKTSITTAASKIYRDYLFQLVGLRYAEVAIDPDDRDVPVPDFAGAAILNLRPYDYGFIPLPADRDLHAAFGAMVRLAYACHQLDLTPHKPIKPPARTRPRAGVA